MTKENIPVRLKTKKASYSNFICNFKCNNKSASDYYFQFIEVEFY